MSNKKVPSLNGLDFFSNATQEAITSIENVLHEHQCMSPSLNDLLYFCCIFLRLILSHFDVNKRDMMSLHLREVLNIAADDGKSICNAIKLSKIDTQENRDQAMQTMIAELGGSGNVNARLFLDVAKHTQSLVMVDDGLWKLDDNLQYTAVLERDMESHLNELIDKKISEANQMNVESDDDNENAKLTFLVCAAINTGVMMGYTSVLYHQSLDEMIDAAIQQISGITSHEKKRSIEGIKLGTTKRCLS